MYTQLTSDLYLRQVNIPASRVTTSERVPVNRIDIKDISGSTNPFAYRMGEDECRRIDTTPDGDYYTLAVFSSSGGDYRVVVKGVEVNKDTRPAIKQIIMDNSRATNMTCFSEVLTELVTIIPDLSRLSKRFAVTFLTDGYPVPNTQQEQKAIEKAIKSVAGSLTSVLLVGYGDYYNKSLMADMAQWFGGVLVHCSAIDRYSAVMHDYMVNSSVAEARVEIDVPKGATNAFTVGASGVIAYEVGDKVLVSPDSGHVYFITNQIDPASQLEDPDRMIDGVYGAALIMSQRLRADVAIDILGRLGDKLMVQQLGNAFTNAEFGNAENMIQSAAQSENFRFVSGRQRNCTPDPNAPCLLDLMDTLVASEGTIFMPRDPRFSYVPIGRGMDYPRGTPVFVEDNVGVPMTDLVWNNERLNMSTRARITGKVKLGEGHEAVGLAEWWPSYKWRTFTIIVDGQLNVTTLPVVLPDDLRRELGLGYGNDGVTVINLTDYPIINRNVVDKMPNATQLCKLAWASLELAAQAKVYRTLIDEIKGDKVDKLADILTPEQDQFLRRHGITKNGFSPVGKEIPATDHYDAYKFAISINGSAEPVKSLPSLKEVRQRQDDKKGPSKWGGLMLPHYEDYVSQALHGNGDLPWLETGLQSVVKEKRAIDGQIQRAKFAVVLGKQWFPEFQTRDDCKLTVDGVEFEFILKPIQVKI